MRKVILDLTMSLDGFIEGPNREIDWSIFDEEAAISLNEFIPKIDAVLYGRVSSEIFGYYMPPAEIPKEGRELYESVNKMTKYVFSYNLLPSSGKYHSYN